jgi:hypothetical protein
VVDAVDFNDRHLVAVNGEDEVRICFVIWSVTSAWANRCIGLAARERDHPEPDEVRMRFAISRASREDYL